MPTQNRFSRGGKCSTSVARPFSIALIPVCLGVGGGPAGCPTICSRRDGDESESTAVSCADACTPTQIVQTLKTTRSLLGFGIHVGSATIIPSRGRPLAPAWIRIQRRSLTALLRVTVHPCVIARS